MTNDREEDILRGQLSALIHQGREKGLSRHDQAAIAAEVERLWTRLCHARPQQRPGRPPPAKVQANQSPPVQFG